MIVASLVLPGLAHTQDAPATAAAATSWTASASSVLPFDMPSSATLQASPKKVFANYVSAFPVSIDNQNPSTDYYARNYNNPNGEGGKHSAYGGYFRDRPLPRAPRPETNWKLLDMEAEVRQALSVGIDGFNLVIYNLPGDANPQMWTNVQTMMQAARNVDPNFKIMLMPDFSGASTLKSKTAAEVAKAMASLTAYSSAYRLSDGRTVISPFTAEGKTVSWWQSFLSIMKTTYQTPVAFWPLFQNEQTWASTFAPISYGMANWGNRNPAWNDPAQTGSTSQMGRVAKIRSMGMKWMHPVSTQDERPRSSIFDEALNTTNLRNTWKIAIDSGAEAVQLVTWNDYPEGSEMAPGTQHGWSYLDISAYYIAWFKTGTRPTITRDGVYLTHRPHTLAAKPSYPQTAFMKLRGGSPARDTVEALTILKAPASVTVQVGSTAHVCQQAAGVDTCTVPLAPGRVSAKVVRSGVTVAGVTSATTVKATPYVQDLRYHAASSGRSPSDGGNGTVPTSTVAVPKTVTVAAVADTYGNAGAPTNNYGTTSMVTSRGNVGASSYMRYAVPATPSGTTLTGAVLRLQTTTSSDAGTTNTHSITRASDSWTETGLTWNTRPSLSGSALGSIRAAAVNSQVSTTLSTAAVQSFAGSQVTLALTSTGTDNLSAWSRNYAVATARPALLLTYTPTLSSAAPSAPSSTATTVAPVADVWVNAGAPTANYAGTSSLSSRGSIGAVSYLRFTLPSLPAGRTLTGASLKFRTTTDPSSGSVEPHTVALANNSWSEATATWNSRPSVSSTVVGSLPSGTAPNTGYTAPLNVATLSGLQGTQVTLAITNTGTDSLWLWSANHASSTYRPVLQLTYS